MKVLDVKRLAELLELDGERRGWRYWARCKSGLHEDRNPSWNIWIDGPNAGLFHCFSCKWSGNAKKLVMHVKEIDEEAAERFLMNLESEKKIPPMRIQYRPLGAASKTMHMPIESIHAPLIEWIPMAKEYVFSRNITAFQVERWGLAYAVCGRLAGRIIIPVYDQEGILLNYSARTFVNDSKRYLMPDTSEHPDESAVFGEQFWDTDKSLLLAEGAINAMALERVADPDEFCVGALMGSHMSPRRALKLQAFANIFVFTDPDAAGESAALRVYRGLGEYVNIRRIRLPPEKDAADLSPVELAKLVRSCQREAAP